MKSIFQNKKRDLFEDSGYRTTIINIIYHIIMQFSLKCPTEMMQHSEELVKQQPHFDGDNLVPIVQKYII